MILRTALLLTCLAAHAVAQEAKSGASKAAPESGKAAATQQVNPAPAKQPAPASEPATGNAPEAEVAAPPAPGEASDAPALISSEIGGRDLMFLQSALEVGRLEGWLGDLAKNKAETEQIKAMGDAVDATQAESNRFLSRLARSKGIDLPGSKAVSPQQKKIAEQLGALRGPKFEKALIEQIASAAQQSVAVYEGAMKSKDEQIRRFAEQMLPIAKEKLTLATRISGNAPAGSSPNFRGAGPGGLE